MRPGDGRGARSPGCQLLLCAEVMSIAHVQDLKLPAGPGLGQEGVQRPIGHLALLGLPAARRDMWAPAERAILAARHP